MKLKTRLLSLFLSICLLFTMVPYTAPAAEAASGVSAMVTNFLISRGITAAVTGISAIGRYTGNTETAAMINKWVFNVIDTTTPILQAIESLSKQMVALHQEVMAELDFIEEKIDGNMSDIEAALGSAATNDAYDNYLSAWNTDVTLPLAANGYHQVVNAYKGYLEYAGSYKTGSSVSYGGVQITATQDMVASSRSSFRAALESFSGAVYDSSIHGNDMTAYYDHVLYETNVVDLKVKTAINNLIGRLINASDAPAGTRYLDRAAQVAYAYFPYSEDQAAFVDAAIMKQSHELSMALLAYQEFIGMRAEYCQAKYEAQKEAGLSDQELEALEAQLRVYCEPNDDILELIYGGQACIYAGGATAALGTWLSQPIYISNSEGSYLYLEDYIRATDTDTVTLTNTSFAQKSSFDTILAESKAEKVATMINTMVNYAMLERDHVAHYTVTSADTVSQQMTFIRRGMVTANRSGRATVKPVYLLADPTEDKSGRLMQDLNWDNPKTLEYPELIAYNFAVPHVDYYNLRDGVYSDGVNQLTMVSGAQLKALMDNNHLSAQGDILRNYFADVLGAYPEGRNLVMLTSEGTASGTGSNNWTTEYKGLNMLTNTSFETENVSHDALSNTSYTVLLAGEDVTYGKLTVESDTLKASLSGDGYDEETGITAAGSAVTLAITPQGCQKVSRITAQYHEDPTDSTRVTYTDVLVDEGTINALSYNSEGSVELVYYMPYANVTLVVEGENGHTFSDDGFCPTCGAYEPAVQTENSHLITNAGQLYWFSAAIRGDMTHISESDLPELDVGQNMAALYGTITAPIDLSVASDPWVPIGNAQTPYLGSFDGGNQPITNLNGSLFGYASSATLRNIAIESGTFGPTDQESAYIGSIAARLNGTSTMTHCYSKSICTGSASIAAGGLVGSVNNGIIRDCYFAGSLSSASDCVVGGLVGSCGQVVIENCSVSASIRKAKSGGLLGNAAAVATITNSYYNTDLVASASACYSNTGLAPDAAKDYVAYEGGEVTYLLNAGREIDVWYQTLGEQSYPEFTGLRVYYIEGSDDYVNDPTVASYVAAVYEAGQQVDAYESLAAAVAACTEGQYVVLLNDVTENVTVASELYLDLNGKTLTGNVTGEGILYAMDNSGDDYQLPEGRIEGTVSCELPGNFKTDITGDILRYMAIADETGYTFHRIYVGITHMSLKPGNTGVGYKAVFGADETVQALLAETETYGFTLWVGDGEKHTFTKNASDFVSGKYLTLRLQNFNVAGYGETPVYGKVFMKLANGTVIESSVYSYTLRELLENVADNLTSYTETQLTALQAMINANAAAMEEWDIDPIRNYSAN